MRSDTIAGKLFKILWTAERIEDYSVVVIDRRVGGGLREINLKDVKIFKDRLVVGGKVTIPIHRVVAIKWRGEVVWRRRGV